MAYSGVAMPATVSRASPFGGPNNGSRKSNTVAKAATAMPAGATLGSVASRHDRSQRPTMPVRLVPVRLNGRAPSSRQAPSTSANSTSGYTNTVRPSPRSSARSPAPNGSLGSGTITRRTSRSAPNWVSAAAASTTASAARGASPALARRNRTIAASVSPADNAQAISTQTVSVRALSQNPAATNSCGRR